jgi:hypothetical protein
MQKTKSRSRGSVWKAVTALKLQKRGEAGLIHWPYRVDKSQRTSCSDVLGKADPCDRPQKIKCKPLMSSVLHDHSSYREAILAAGHTSIVKFQRTMKDIKRLISTIGRNSFYYLLCPSAALI